MPLFTDEEIDQLSGGEKLNNLLGRSIHVTLIPIYFDNEQRRKVGDFLSQFYDIENSKIGVGWHSNPFVTPSELKENSSGDVKIVAGMKSIEGDEKVEVCHNGDSEYVHKDKIDSDFIESLVKGETE